MKRIKKMNVKIGNIEIGGSNKIAIQSMSSYLPSDTELCIKELKGLELAGADILRVACETIRDAQAISLLKKEISVPIVADIHFNHKLGIEAIKAGADKIRFNPGNIGSDENLKELIDCAIAHDTAVRIGVNSGSIHPKFESMNISLIDKAFKSLSLYVRKCEKLGLKRIVLSAKLPTPTETIEVYKKISKKFKYPLHLGVTESGIGEEALIKSTVALSPLLLEGIGDTFRVSLTGNKLEEIRAAKEILKCLNLEKGFKLVSCPACGRCSVNLEEIVLIVKEELRKNNPNITVAIMGCIVNGPGEARHADIGIAFAKSKASLFKKGEIITQGSKDEILSLLIEEIKKAK